MSLLSEEDIEVIKNRSSEILRYLGFGDHETQVIIALNQMTSSTVADLSIKTGIHHANLYSILEGLETRGLVLSNNGRPRVYQFAPLAHLKDILTSKLIQLITDLKRLQEMRGPTGATATLIYTISGKDDVQSKMLSMISRTQERILFTGPSINHLGESILEALVAASERDIDIRAIVGTKIQNPEFNFQHRIREDTLAVNLVTDGNESLISMPDLSVCGYSENPIIALQLEGFLEQNWNLARTN